MVEGAAAVKNSLKMSSLFKLSETPIAGRWLKWYSKTVVSINCSFNHITNISTKEKRDDLLFVTKARVRK